jgi:hypothetical protein
LHDNTTTSTHGCNKKILRYIKGTINLGLLFPRKDVAQIMGYVNANWARDLDRRRSTIGLLFKLGCNSIMWSSKLQPIVALSMMEVEYKPWVDGAREVVWLRKITIELGLHESSPITISCDNLNAINLVKNPMLHAKMKHIKLHHHYIHEKIEVGEIDVTYISTNEQEVDIMTKPLGKEKFEIFRRKIKLHSVQE